MIDFTQEFWHTATTAWACGVISVLCAFEAWRQKQFRWQLIGGILAGLTGVLCPATLTRGYYEMVQVNQELAVLVAAKKAEGVDDVRVVQLAATNVVESRGGRRYERCEYTDGTRASWMRDLSGRTGPIDRRIGHDLRPDRLQPGTTLDLPTGKGTGVRWY
ncbi:MAG: hypothetical protein ACK6EB_25170 [Planctomyces sp.]